MIVQCGFPRAGSTLLYLMLKYSVSNYNFFDREMKALKVLTDENIITKRPLDIFEHKKILNKFPNTKFIINIRDLRSILTSIHERSEGKYKVNWNYSVNTSKTGIIPGQTKGLLDYINIIHKVPNSIFIFYEDIIKNSDTVQRKLQEFCGFEYKGKFSDFYKQNIPNNLKYQLNGVRPIDIKSLEKWRDHIPRIKQQFNECPQLLDELISLEYEQDKEWLKKLN